MGKNKKSKQVVEIIHDSDTDTSVKVDEMESDTTLSENKSPVLLVLEQYTEHISSLDENEEKLNELFTTFLSERKELLNERRKLKRECIYVLKKLPKTYETTVKKLLKEKRKRKGATNSGINKPTKVPIKIRKYLSLDDELRSRPQVIHLLNEKLKADGCRQGKTIILNKKVAKLFDKNKGHTIEFNGFSKFLAEVYNEEKSQSV
jgi:hypothetical protein